MSKTLAGIVLDFVDDPYLIKGASIPQHIKEAAQSTPAITSSDYASMSENDFAIVFLTKHGHHIPKYPVHNQFHAWAAAESFGKTASRMPPSARVVAATFIKRACQLHGIQYPGYLDGISDNSLHSNIYSLESPPHTKTATTTVGDVFLKALTPEQRKAFRDKQDLSSTGPENGINTEAVQAVLGIPGGPRSFTQTSEVDFNSDPDSPHAELDARAQALRDNYETKVASVLLSDNIKTAAQAVLVQENANSFGSDEYGIVTDDGNHYPLFTLELTKRASQFFQDNYTDLFPKFRREMATKIARKLSGFGQQVPELVSKYASDAYSNQLALHIHSRKECVSDRDAHAILDVLYEKRASINPEQFAGILEQFDRENGIDRYWDTQINDPYYATFASKLASDGYVYDDGTQSIKEAELTALAADPSALEGYLDPEIISEFQKNAVAIFDSLPRPHKGIIIKAANDKLEKRASMVWGDVDDPEYLAMLRAETARINAMTPEERREAQQILELNKLKMLTGTAIGGSLGHILSPGLGTIAGMGLGAAYGLHKSQTPGTPASIEAYNQTYDQAMGKSANIMRDLKSDAQYLGRRTRELPQSLDRAVRDYKNYKSWQDYATDAAAIGAAHSEDMRNTREINRLMGGGQIARPAFPSLEARLADVDQIRNMAKKDFHRSAQETAEGLVLPGAAIAGLSGIALAGHMRNKRKAKEDEQQGKEASMINPTPGAPGVKPVIAGKPQTLKPVIPMTERVSGVTLPDARIVDSSTKMGSDQLKGGIADNKKPSDFDPASLREGTKVEMEHVDDEQLAQEIAMDHLAEDPEYYRKLKQVEGSNAKHAWLLARMLK